MKDFLKTVTQERARDAQTARRRRTLEVLRELTCLTTSTGRSFRASLRKSAPAGYPRIIAEIKRASPSAGLIRVTGSIIERAQWYQQAGATAISVLTEPRHFRGSDDDLRAVCEAVDLPVLRKDFISDPYQIYESAALGANAVLLITAALESARLRELYDTARALHLDVLVEVHTPAELEQALLLPDGIIGVNTRNLRTLKTDLTVAHKLAALIPRDRIAIAESGIRTRRNIENLQAAGYRGFLIGESLMRAEDPRPLLRALIDG